MSAPRLALLTDFPEEEWPSMALVAEQLLLGLKTAHADQFDVTGLCPAYIRRMTRLLGPRGPAKNADRLFNRFVIYPRYVRKISREFDLFHVADHSYSQLVHSLPKERTGVFCHDLDTFRCILDPVADRRPRWFKAMTKRILSGMQKASIVFHSTQLIRDQIIRYGLIDPEKLVRAPYGVAEEFVAASVAAARGDFPTGLPATIGDEGPFLLHVGSCIPRKRIDVLLDVFAAIRRQRPEMRLVKIGGDWTAVQREQIDRLGIGPGLISLNNVSRSAIAACYRQAALVLMPSEAEGFGLPVAEALACGAIILCSDIPVLREVGGDAAVYAPLADVPAWTEAAMAILDHPASAPSFDTRLTRAAHFTWKKHASIVAAAYQKFFASQASQVDRAR